MKSYSLSEKQGELLVKRARKVVTEFLNGVQDPPDKEIESQFSFDSGVFVTITKVGDSLRGCIGFPLPHKKLYLAIDEAAIAAATQDPRFSPITPYELEKVKFEVTVLTPPVPVTVDDPAEYLQKIVIGRDGLIVRKGPQSGLLLPQVPTEYGWNTQEFLNNTCQKAGLDKDCWKDPDTEILRFEGTVFKETEPNGRVIRESQ